MGTRKTPSSPRRRSGRSRSQPRLRRSSASTLELEAHSAAPRGRRLRRKKKPSLWWRRFRFVLVILCLIGGAWGLYLALTSPDFQVASVSVSGAQITPEKELFRIQQSLIGQNWLRAKTDAAHQRLVGIPTVKNARVTHAVYWPPRLHIHLEERTPFARVGSGSDWWVVDESGVPFRRAEDKKDRDLYSLTGPNLLPRPGVPLPKEQWQPSARLLHALERERDLWSLRRIYLDKNGFASLRLQGGAHDEMLIRLGADRWEDKLVRARTALTYIERIGERAKSLNLVSYNMPQWTPFRSDDERSVPETGSDNAGT